MKIITQDFRKGFVKLKTENLDDLWYLSHILEKGDKVSSVTYRKIKLGEGDERKTKIIKKKLKLEIDLEKIQFSETADSLRLSGIITQGREDIPSGDYHTLNVGYDSELSISKPQEFLGFQIKKLKEASENKNGNILICTLDRDSAYFAILKKYGYEMISDLKGDVQKKQFQENTKSSFFKDVASKLKEYKERHKITKIILGCPNFWKSYISQEIEKAGIEKTVSYSTVNSEGENAIKEVLKRPEIKDVLKDERFSQELNLIDELLSRIAKDQNAEYGLSQVEEAANLGACENLLVSDKLIQEMREKEEYERLDKIMRTVDSSGGDVHIISAENEAGEKLNSLSGIACFLRFRIR
ncbi:MAG: mRNA surveillance protein pelota [Candidatus Woesearchaeota archaeon]